MTYSRVQWSRRSNDVQFTKTQPLSPRNSWTFRDVDREELSNWDSPNQDTAFSNEFEKIWSWDDSDAVYWLEKSRADPLFSATQSDLDIFQAQCEWNRRWVCTIPDCADSLAVTRENRKRSNAARRSLNEQPCNRSPVIIGLPERKGEEDMVSDWNTGNQALQADVVPTPTGWGDLDSHNSRMDAPKDELVESAVKCSTTNATVEQPPPVEAGACASGWPILSSYDSHNSHMDAPRDDLVQSAIKCSITNKTVVQPPPVEAGACASGWPMLSSYEKIAPTGWGDVDSYNGHMDGTREDQIESAVNSSITKDSSLQPPATEAGPDSDWAALTSYEKIAATGWGDVNPSGWQDFPSSYENISPTGWGDLPSETGEGQTVRVGWAPQIQFENGWDGYSTDGSKRDVCGVYPSVDSRKVYGNSHGAQPRGRQLNTISWGAGYWKPKGGDSQEVYHTQEQQARRNSPRPGKQAPNFYKFNVDVAPRANRWRRSRPHWQSTRAASPKEFVKTSGN